MELFWLEHFKYVHSARKLSDEVASASEQGMQFAMMNYHSNIQTDSFAPLLFRIVTNGQTFICMTEVNTHTLTFHLSHDFPACNSSSNFLCESQEKENKKNEETIEESRILFWMLVCILTKNSPTMGDFTL